MALIVNQNDERTELQKQVAAELQAKTNASASYTKSPDGVDDSGYLKNTKQTTSLAWVWAIIIVVTIVLVLRLIIK